MLSNRKDNQNRSSCFAEFRGSRGGHWKRDDVIAEKYLRGLDYGKRGLRASSYEPGNRAGSVTGTNSVVCSYGKFQPGRPG